MADAGKVWRTLVWGGAGAVLLAATVASRTVEGFDWTLGDFVAAGAILGTICLGFELATRGLSGHAARAAACLGLLGAFLVVWINLAVGIIGDSDNRANLVFLPVLLVGATGALGVRFRVEGMARVMGIVTACQVALAAGLILAHQAPAAILTLGIGALWGISALLYRSAAGGQRQWTA